MPDLQTLGDRLAPRFEENFEHEGELGAAVSVYHHSRPVAELYGGYTDVHRTERWNPETMVLIWSATKGLSSACLLHAMQEKKISLDARVSDFWPEFGTNGKAGLTIGQLLSHQAGLAALDQSSDILDYAGVVRALEQQEPLWPPGSGHGYHARTFGFLVDELLHRIDRRHVGEYWRATFGEPLGLDIWIGLPPEKNHQVATIYAARNSRPAQNPEFYAELARPGSLAARTFASPKGLSSVAGMNKPEIRSTAIASFSAIANASSLAKFYAILANGGKFENRVFFTEETLGWMSNPLTDGIDLVFRIPTAFSAGFMKDSRSATTRIFGPSATAFGHPGAGGSHAFADPENGLSFAYVMNQMERTVLPTSKSLRLVEAIYSRA